MKPSLRLTALRPANLLLLLALPFLFWLFLTSPDYSRSLTAIIGVERGSSALLAGFFLSLILFGGAIAASRTHGPLRAAPCGRVPCRRLSFSA